MKPTYSGYEGKKVSGFAQVPPAGVYIAEIQGVRTEESYDKTRDVIVLMLEITEGEYANQYHKVYEDQRASFGDRVKYRGTFKLTPYMNGDEDWVRHKFEGNLYCVEQSNPGYHWDWDETKLKGKKVGINVRNNLYTAQNGADKETTEIGQLETIEDVRNGRCRMMKDRDSRQKSSTRDYSDVSGTVDVPF